MLGMNSTTGAALNGTDHIVQSIRDIITTPIGSRVMLRNYGCKAPELVDRPVNELFDVELKSSIAEALARWEPRFTLRQVAVVSRTAQGRVIISIEGTIRADATEVRIEGITL